MTKALIALLSQTVLVTAVLAQCPDGYEPVQLSEAPELAACSCAWGEVVCIDDIEPVDGLPLCSEAPVCDEYPEEEYPPEEEIPACGAFSFGSLFDYLSWQEEDSSALVKKFRPLFGDAKDLWALREVEDESAHSDLLDLIEYLVTPISEDESFGDEYPDEDDDYYEEEPIDEELPAEGLLCYSIEDLLVNLSEEGCSAREKRIFSAAYPHLKKAIAPNGPFVRNEIEDRDGAADIKELLHEVALKCLTKKELKKLQKKNKR